MRTFKRVQGMQVVARQEGAIIGKLDDFLFELQTGIIAGWRVKTGSVFAKGGGVAAGDLELLGRDVVIIRGEAAVEWAGSGRPKPVDGRAWASAYLGTGALTRAGQALAEVKDLIVDDVGNRLRGLLLADGRLLVVGAQVQLGPSAVIVENDGVPLTLPESEEEWWAAITAAVTR